MAFVIVLNSKSSCSASGYCESQAGAMTAATGAAVFEIVFGFLCSFHFMVATTRCCVASITPVCKNVALQMVALNTLGL